MPRGTSHRAGTPAAQNARLGTAIKVKRPSGISTPNGGYVRASTMDGSHTK
jgi:hypothetical protein